MRIRKRKMLSRSSRYVRYDPDTKSFEFRTPVAVVSWPQPLRERIIRDFRYPISGMLLPDYQAYKEHMEKPSWKLSGSTVRFSVTYLTHASGRKIPVTLLGATKLEKLLLLNNNNPIMRSLMVYSYLTGEDIGGLPDLKLLDKDIIQHVDASRKKK